MQKSPHVYWLTGLPASGKTTLARAWEAHLAAQQVRVVCLDGDELRKGLCADLGLDGASRSEHIRRAGEVARLMHAAGLTVVCAFVSPFAKDRDRVRHLFAPGEFSEIHLSTSLEECMRRDPKGLYTSAQKGEIRGLTGWDAPYEVPTAAECTFDTALLAPADMLQMLQLRISANPPLALGAPHHPSGPV
jgi:adenylyl-sulfate kinase